MKTRGITYWLVLLVCAGCWDTVTHVYDCNDDDTGSADGTDTDTETETGPDTDIDSGLGRHNLPDGWQGFAEACESDEDCVGYPGERRCLHDVLGIINVPGGYCSACCDEPAIDGCAVGIDCVGAMNAYLVCLSHCDSYSDCRQSEGYECRPIYYIPEDFPGNYCLPNEEEMVPDTDEQPQVLECPWPWL